MPLFILNVRIAEPPTASRTANRGGMRAWLVVRRYGLTEMLQVRARWFVLFHQHASDRNSVGRLRTTLSLALSCSCFVGESATSHSRLFIQILGGNIILRDFMRVNFHLVSVLGILNAHNHLGFECITFFEQLIHTLRVRTFYVRQSLQIT